MRYLAVVAWALTTQAVPLTVRAQSSTNEAARRFYNAGNQAYAERRYADAARAFREAHAISHRPELLYNLGIALAAAGDAQGAVEALTLFRDAGAPGFDDRAELDRQIDEQRAIAAGQRPVSPSHAQPEVRVVERRVVEPRWLRVETRYERPTIHAVGPWIAVGIGAALTVGSIVTGVLAEDRAALLRDVNEGREPWSPTAASARTEGTTQATLSMAFGVAGGAALTAGVLWFLLRGPGRRVEVPVRGTVVPLYGGAALPLGGTL